MRGRVSLLHSEVVNILGDVIMGLTYGGRSAESCVSDPVADNFELTEVKVTTEKRRNFLKMYFF